MSEPFAALRPYLFSIAYRMLSSVADAEDVVQEAYLRYHRAEAQVESPQGIPVCGRHEAVHRPPALGTGATRDLRR